MRFLSSKTRKIEVKGITSPHCGAVLVKDTGQLFFNVRQINTVALFSGILLSDGLPHGGKTKQNQDTERCKIWS